MKREMVWKTTVSNQLPDLTLEIAIYNFKSLDEISEFVKKLEEINK